MTASARAARLALRALGWTCVDLPARPVRAVMVVYPHTSNWDFPVGLLAKVALRLDARWVGKDTLFRPPFGRLMRWLGGIPVNRREHTGFVARMTEELRDRDRFLLTIAPEGTRGRRPGWKSGFYRIARAADVPVLVAVIDYARRRVGMVASIALTGDEPADMARIAECFQGCRGRRPELASPIRLIER
jgi:1-acyl-sn-glycerol-3-phosphate acyltransferase